MLYRIARKLSWISQEKRLELFPPFMAMRIKVIHFSDDGRELVIRLPLNRFNRNPGGGMFGGAMASLADPVAALMCANLFPDYAVWTRHMEIDFNKEGRSDLQLRLSISEQQLEQIRAELDERQRATPTFEYAYYDDNEALCATVINRVAIRLGSYRPSSGALGFRRAQ